MRRPTSPRLARGALLAVAAGVWLAAARELWDTSVPDGLRLGELEIDRYFTRAESERAESYERFLRVDFLLSQLALVATLAVYAVRGPGLVRESAAGRIGTGMLLGMLGLGILWLVQLPFAAAAHWWNRRHGLTELGYLQWLLDDWLALAAGFLFISLALLIVMAFAVALADRWWVAAAPAFVGLAMLFAFVYPYLLPDVRALRDRELAAEARRLARLQGVEDVPVRVEEIGDEATVPNALAAGLGVSRRVVLWDTLLDGRFTDGEVATVLAHEYAHHAREHLPKALGWYVLFAVPGTFFIALATRRRGGMREPGAVPLSLLVLVLLELAALPAQNAISRRLEAEADWEALQVARDPASARTLFQKLTRIALADPSPPTWSYVLLETHPAILERIAMAEAWHARSSPRARAARRRATGGG